MAHSDHARRLPRGVQAYLDDHSNRLSRFKARKQALDMREQLHDLGSERDWYRLNTVGVHLRTNTTAHTFTVDLAEWEITLLGDLARVYYAPEIVHSTRSQAYEVGFDGYFVERSMCAIRVEPVVQDVPMVVTESDYARKKARKHQANLQARRRTLTDEQRKEILRRESVGMRGFSRV